MLQEKNDTALSAAGFLLQIKAIVLNPSQPIQWSSGWKSPIYCDNRKILSYPKIRNFFRQALCENLQNKFGKPDLIVGVATGGIAIGALVAQQLNLPFAYVRGQAKEHGLSKLIEGHYVEGQSVVVVEDLISTGNSVLSAVSALREANLNVKGVVSIFTYEFEEAAINFINANCKLSSVTDYHSLLQQALDTGFIKKEDLEKLSAWREDPRNWH